MFTVQSDSQKLPHRRGSFWSPAYKIKSRRSDTKLILKIIGIFFAAIVISVLAVVLLMPWMDRWGASVEETVASLPWDELVLSPNIGYTRGISIHASPEQIYPWIAQIGAGKGGWYSYDWFETNILRCQNSNA